MNNYSLKFAYKCLCLLHFMPTHQSLCAKRLRVKGSSFLSPKKFISLLSPFLRVSSLKTAGKGVARVWECLNEVIINSALSPPPRLTSFYAHFTKLGQRVAIRLKWFWSSFLTSWPRRSKPLPPSSKKKEKLWLFETSKINPKICIQWKAKVV